MQEVKYGSANGVGVLNEKAVIQNDKERSDIIIHLDYEDEFKDGKVEVNIIASEPEELIRCKDCKYWKITSDGFGECNVMEKQFLGKEYCSFGEKKNDD